MHAIGTALAEQLRAKKCPVPVVDGPELATKLPTHERIVIEQADDAFGPVRSQHQNPKSCATRMVGGKITIYAQSTRAGATHFEHEDRADKILDQVVFGLHVVSRLRKVSWTPKSGRMVPIEEYAKSELPPGAKYELLFTFDRAVQNTTFHDEARPTGTIAGVSNTTRTTLAGAGDDVPPETSCGG